MYKILMTQQDINNLKIFLERVNMTGKEVSAYVNILKAISEAKKDGDD